MHRLIRTVARKPKLKVLKKNQNVVMLIQRAILYIRVSTDEQAEKGYSLKHQEEKLQSYCNQNNIDIADIYKEDYSAKTFSRPEFSKLFSVLKNKKHSINFLLFLKWD